MTLLIHAHILQLQHYLNLFGGRLNNIVLLTPNEQISAQHERELQASGLRARLFSAEAGADLFSPIEIIGLNKLVEKKGVKRVAVQDFGDNNLVLVDEGHLRLPPVSRGRLRQGLRYLQPAERDGKREQPDAALLTFYQQCCIWRDKDTH